MGLTTLLYTEVSLPTVYVRKQDNTFRILVIGDSVANETEKDLRHFRNVIFRKINGYDLRAFNNNYFDCLYSFTTFFHFDFELVVNYFAEIKRVLKPEGIAIIEFKRWMDTKDVINLLNIIEQQGGIQKYEAELDKWRYVSKEMLEVLYDYYNLTVIDKDITQFTFRKEAQRSDKE